MDSAFPDPTQASSTVGPESSSAPTAPSRAQSSQNDGPQKKSTIPTPPSLSLPKGGGSIHGMGEKVDVAAATGAGNASIPIKVSSGRAGLQPDLSLQYSSGQGNGPFGLGWQMQVPSVTRKTDKGLPRYMDAGPDADADVFLLYNAEDLVPVFARDAQGNIALKSDGKPLIQDTVSGNYKVRTYQPRIEGLFSRIERWVNATDSGDIYWRVISVDNVTSIYGKDDNSRIFNPISTPGQAKTIFSWLLSESFDDRGNAMVFSYKAEDSANVDATLPHEANRLTSSRSTHRYLKTIRYGNQVPNRDPSTWIPTSAANLPSTTWLFTVLFDYGEHDLNNPTFTETSTWPCRADPFSTYKPGFEDRIYRLCRRVLMFHQFNELGSTPLLVGSTEFEYQEDPAATKLVQCIQAGFSPSGNTSSPYIRSTLPPVQFKYTEFPSDAELASRVIQDVDPAYLENLPIGVDGSTYQWLDLYSEGLPGIFSEQDGGWFFNRNSSANNALKPGSGTNGKINGNVKRDAPKSKSDINSIPIIQPRFDPTISLNNMPSFSIHEGQSHFGDVNGDGHLDLIYTEPGCSGFFETTDDKGWIEFRAFASYPNIPSGETKLIDLTGDGLADILIASDQIYTWCQSLGDEGYDEPATVIQANQDSLGPVSIFSDTENYVLLADFSGDGLKDIVRIRNGDICYWPNLGYGHFGPMVRMDNAPWFEAVDLFETKRVRLADIDGSGTTDLLHVHSSGVDIYLNQAGNGFSDRKRIEYFPEDTVLSTIDTIDLLGNGTTCLVWSTTSPQSVLNLRYLDIIGGPKPHLLTKTINNMGKETSIHYVPSTKFYLQDRQESRPWLTRLPFPVYCVEKMETVDRISGNRLVNKYRYHDGFYDGLEREFRGFAMVERWDTDDFAEMSSATATNVDSSWHVPPVHTKTWYHTGVYIDDKKITTHWAHEYFGTVPGAAHNLLDDTVLPTAPLLGGNELREACRALKGRVLRSEVYADDGMSKAAIPYSISESNYTIEVVQPLQDANLHSVYWVHPREHIEYSCERNPDDARIHHEITLQTDSVGNVLKSIKISYGRTPGKSALTGTDLTKQETTLFLYTESDVTNVISSEYDYRTPSIYEARDYEVSGLTPGQGTQMRFSDFGAPAFTPLTTLTDIPFETPNNPATKQKRLISRSRIFYRSDDFTGLLPAGQIGKNAIPGCEYRQCFTPGLLSTVFQRQLPNQPMQSLLPDPSTALAGTGDQQAGYVDLDKDSNWWIPSGRVFFHPDPSASASQELQVARSNFFSARRFMDAFGNSSVINLDEYDLFPTYVQDPVGNTRTATMDYRVLLPSLITNSNGNRAAVAFDALGYVVGTAVMGKVTENLGDSLAGFQTDLTQAQIDQFFANPRGSGSTAASLLGSATTRTIYNVNRYWQQQSGTAPAYSATISREAHVHDLPRAQTSALQINFAYVDGFQRVIQSKTQAKPGPLTPGGAVNSNRWTGSGWALYNNKGLPVRKYEPFFDDTHEFKFFINGVSTISLYDPLGRVVGTLKPDKTLDKVRFDPWMQTMFDGNDNVLIADPTADPDIGPYLALLPAYEYSPSWYAARISGAMGTDEQAAAEKTASHANTPMVVHLDVLGRTFITVKDNGTGGKMTTRSAIDIQGNQYALYDALDREIIRFDFDMTGKRLHQASPDSGERWALCDIGGRVLLSWNSRGFRQRSVYDTNRRLTENHLRDDSVEGSSPPESLVGQYVYGESVPNASASNLREKTYLVRDQAGTATTPDFDFKGNLLRSERCFAQNYKSVVDWSQTVGLESQIFVSTTTYDALNRIVTATSPDQSITYRTYNESGRLEQMWVNIRGQVASPDPTTWTLIIKTSDYNARGQVTTVSHGNGVQTIRTYDPQTFRLTRIQSLLAGTTGQTVLQDISYIHDPVGNITSAKDSAQQTIYFRNTVVDASNDYTYDPVYRLITATSREHLGQANQPNIPSSSDSANTGLPQPGDGNAMARYVESYTYDLADNMTKLSHAGSDASVPGWTRNFTYDSSSNHLLSSSVGPSTETYAYDVHGNMIALPSLSSMAWNFLDQLQSTSRQVVNSGTPETTYYSYDILGNRVRKVTERAAVAEQTPVKLKERLYIGASEIFRTSAGNGSTVSLERETLSINGEAGREAIIETRTVGDDKSPQQQIRFQFTNFIGSTVLELGMDGGVVSYEEYSPYGDTTYQAVASTLDAPKRYRYSAKERDEESGLYYYGARYYASWLGYWISADPSGVKSGANQYNFCHDNPIVNFDATGREDLPKEGKLMEAWDYAKKLPKELKAIAHNLQREHPITVELRKWQTGGEYSRDVSAAQHELTVLVETGKGYFHTEVGKLQKVVNARVRAGLIKFESDLMEETKAIYHQAAAATGAVVNEAELNKVLINNSGTLHTLHGPSGSGAAAAAANPNAAVSTITDESFESAFSEWGEAPKAQVAEPAEAPKMTAELEPPASPASESKLAEVAEVEKGVGAELREASKTVSKTHVFKAAGKAVAVASMLSDAATLVDKKASSDEKVHAGIDLVANGLMESGNPVAEAAGVGLMVGNAAEESLHTSDYSSKWGMEANQYLKSKGFSGDTALAGGAVATVLSTPVALAVSAYDKVKSWF